MKKDLRLLSKILLNKICKDNPKVLSDPPTIITFEGFGDSSLTFVIRVFVANLDDRHAVMDELHTSIDKEFKQAGIEIAFPQRDLHLRSIDQSLMDNMNLKKDNQ